MSNVEKNCLVMVIALALVFITLTGVILFRSTDDVVIEEKNNFDHYFEAVDEVEEIATELLIYWFNDYYGVSDFEQTELVLESIY